MSEQLVQESRLAVVPGRFKVHDEVLPLKAATPPVAAVSPLSKVPSRFMMQQRMNASTPEKVNLRGDVSSLFALACATPAPPARRGAIKAACLEEDSHVIKPETAHVAYVEQAHKGRVRSTLRVRSAGEQKKVMWVEVTAKESKKHFGIMTQIKDAINSSKISTRDEAVDMRNRLLGP